MLGTWAAAADTTVTALLPFAELWAALTGPAARGADANRLEVLHASPPALRRLDRAGGQAALLPVEPVLAARDLRPGVYLLARDLLQDVPVRANNRAVLVARDTVAALTPVRGQRPVRPAAHLVRRLRLGAPPDLYLYLTQRAQYEQMFTGL